MNYFEYPKKKTVRNGEHDNEEWWMGMIDDDE